MSRPPTSILPDNLHQLERIENSLRRVERQEYDEIDSTDNFDVFFPGPLSNDAFALPRAQTGTGLVGDIAALWQAFGERGFIPRVSYFKERYMLADQFTAGAELFWCVHNKIEEGFCTRLSFKHARVMTDHEPVEACRMAA